MYMIGLVQSCLDLTSLSKGRHNTFATHVSIAHPTIMISTDQIRRKQKQVRDRYRPNSAGQRTKTQEEK
jgi:hypothetical protein